MKRDLLRQRGSPFFGRYRRSKCRKIWVFNHPAKVTERASSRIRKYARNTHINFRLVFSAANTDIQKDACQSSWSRGLLLTPRTGMKVGAPARQLAARCFGQAALLQSAGGSIPVAARA